MSGCLYCAIFGAISPSHTYHVGEEHTKLLVGHMVRIQRELVPAFSTGLNHEWGRGSMHC
jgi:hypothetical protein